MNELAATILSLLLIFVLFFTGMIFGINKTEESYNNRMKMVGIECIAYHYSETDGVRSNWYEIVWIDRSKNNGKR